MSPRVLLLMPIKEHHNHYGKLIRPTSYPHVYQRTFCLDSSSRLSLRMRAKPQEHLDFDDRGPLVFVNFFDNDSLLPLILELPSPKPLCPSFSIIPFVHNNNSSSFCTPIRPVIGLLIVFPEDVFSENRRPLRWDVRLLLSTESMLSLDLVKFPSVFLFDL